MEENLKEVTINFLVGIFVLIGIGSLFFLSVKISNNFFTNSSKKSYFLSASFNNIGSLKVAAPIKVSGFIVGKVYNIYLNQHNYQAVVVMELNSDYKFSTDSSAQILTTGLLGEQYIALQSGAESAYLKNGDTISITSSALVLENLIGKFLTNISTK